MTLSNRFTFCAALLVAVLLLAANPAAADPAKGSGELLILMLAQR